MTWAAYTRWAWIAGLAGLAASAVAWMVMPTAFARAWLAALTTWVELPLGCMALLLIHALTGGRWGEAIRPAAIAGIGTLPLLLPAVLPLLWVGDRIYPWLRHGPHMNLSNHFYLNMPFAVARLLFYLAAWFVLAALTLRATRRPGALATLAPPALILLGLTVTFAAIDATESLDPQFNSAVYGMIAAAEAGLFALAICILATTLATSLPVDNGLARLLLALVILWAYLDFIQLLIVWQSDLPGEAAWYLPRIRGGWGLLAGLILLGHFVVPFAALLEPRVRTSRRGIIGVTALLIGMEVLRAWWLILPSGQRHIAWTDIAAMLALAGVATAMMLRTLSTRQAGVSPQHV